MPARPVVFDVPPDQPCLREIELRTAAPRDLPDLYDEETLPGYEHFDDGSAASAFDGESASEEEWDP